MIITRPKLRENLPRFLGGQSAEIIPMPPPRFEEVDLNAICSEILDAEKMVKVSENEVAKAELALDSAQSILDDRRLIRDELRTRLVDLLVRMDVLTLDDEPTAATVIIAGPPPLPEKVDG